MPALIFDLDGTLVDTVYAHVFAWQRALAEAGLPIDGWRIHRRIGMSGGLFTRAVARELARSLTSTQVEALQAHHGHLFRELLPERRPLPEAVELLAELQTAEVPFGIPRGAGQRSTRRSRRSAFVRKRIDAHASEAYERVDDRLAGTRLDKLLDALPQQQRQVIALRYGITAEERTTEQTATDLNISPTRVRALERTALQPAPRAQLISRPPTGCMKRSPRSETLRLLQINRQATGIRPAGDSRGST